MKELITVINEENTTNESLLSSVFSNFDISLIALISSSISAIISVGLGVTGHMIRAWIGSKNRDKHGKSKVKLLQDLKNFTRDLDIDLGDDPIVQSIMNNTGEWTTEMCSELRNAVYNKLTPEQKKLYDILEEDYIKERNKFVKF